MLVDRTLTKISNFTSKTDTNRHEVASLAYFVRALRTKLADVVVRSREFQHSNHPQKMLLEFRVENHRSIRTEQAISFVATPRLGSEDDPRPRQVLPLSDDVLPAIVLYGANASGKSNVLSAVEFMRDAVVHSFRQWERDTGVPRTVFAWGEDRFSNSLFEVTVLIGSTKIEYGFSVNDSDVEEEWIHAWPNGKKQVWLARKFDEFEFGASLKGENHLIQSITRNNSLFLSAASQHQHPQLLGLYNWFRDMYTPSLTSRRPMFRLHRAATQHPLVHGPQLSLFEDDEAETIRIQLKNLFRAADLGIVDLKFRPSEAKMPAGLSNFRVMLKHQEDDEDSWIDLEEESQGTKTLFHLASPLFKVLIRGGFLVVDELESSLHPLIGQSIVQLFNSRDSNPKNAQLLFTTHDTNLIGTNYCISYCDRPAEPILRRDQVWFTEKDPKGATTVYPLTSYKPRKSENLERGYIQGRYGAIPFIGNLPTIIK